MNHSAYQYKDPYPTVEGIKENARYARILLDNYCGQESELTAICQYIYHHMEAEAISMDLSACLRGIAIVEMHHLDLLGSCIRQLGVKPKFRTLPKMRPVNWNSSCIYYGVDLAKMIEMDIKDEYQAIGKYEDTIHMIPEPQIQHLIQRIIEDEKLHIEALEKAYKSL